MVRQRCKSIGYRPFLGLLVWCSGFTIFLWAPHKPFWLQLAAAIVLGCIGVEISTRKKRP